MAQKAKQTKTAQVANSAQNGNGFHKNHSWVPGDPVETHPLAGIAGSYQDDPFWDEFQQAMRDARREEDERDFQGLKDE